MNKEIEIVKANSFNIGDEIRLKPDYKPTHFNEENVLPKDTLFVVINKSNFTLADYSIKIEGYNNWFCASVFEPYNKKQ